MARPVCRCAIAVLALTLGFAGAGAGAATLPPDTVAGSIPAGTIDPTDPFTDDVLLDSLTFGTTTYDYTSRSRPPFGS